MGDDLADQHSFVESKPANKRSLEILIVPGARVARLLVLKSRPDGLVSTNPFVASTFVSEYIRKVVEQRFHFESIKSSWNAPDRFKNLLAAQYPHAK